MGWLLFFALFLGIAMLSLGVISAKHTKKLQKKGLISATNPAPPKPMSDAKAKVITIGLMLLIIFGVYKFVTGLFSFDNDDDEQQLTQFPTLSTSEPKAETNPYLSNNPPLSEAKTPYQRFLFKYVSMHTWECYRLKYTIQSGMDDPSSYEHVKTEMHMNEKTFIVTAKTTIRGKNKFGALVLAQFKATLDTNGEILTIKQLD